MKKGRHRRFEEARALKRTNDLSDLSLETLDAPGRGEPCPECDTPPGEDHASWCLAPQDDDEAAGEA